MDGLVVLDLYAGTGALALEAISRGAARATLVENDARACAAIFHNVESLRYGERCRLLRDLPAATQGRLEALCCFEALELFRKAAAHRTSARLISAIAALHEGED